jgi:membrane protease YdiL (CAAX protease family)
MKQIKKSAGRVDDVTGAPGSLIGRLLSVWFVANFLIVGVVSALAGRWYLGWMPRALGILAELVLVHLYNLLLPLWLLRRGWFRPSTNLRDALGWRWAGGRTLAGGVIAFLLLIGLNVGANLAFGDPIPYNLPGEEGTSADSSLAALGLLFIFLIFVVWITVAEETMFRGLIQTQLTTAYSAPLGILGAALLFGLRHLPADLFYASIWGATPQMWLCRQIQLYGAGLLLGLARHYGRLTYAPWITHLLIFGSSLFV